MKYLIEQHGKTHGGVISEEIEKAILLLIKNGNLEQSKAFCGHIGDSKLRK